MCPAITIDALSMPRAYALDFLRLLASLAIAMGHVTRREHWPGHLHSYLLAGLSSSLFFLLSGFVLAASQGFWKRSLARHAAERAYRLLPPHWFAFALLVPLALTGADRVPTEEFLQVLWWWLPGLQSLMPPGETANGWNYPAWAITPLLIGGLTLPWLRWSRLRERGAVWIVALLVLLYALRLGLTWMAGAPANTGEYHALHTSLWPRVLEVNLGALAALWLERQPAPLGGKDQSFALWSIVCLLLLVVAAEFGGAAGKYYFTHGLCVAPLLALIASAYRNRGLVQAFASHPALAYVASSSLLIWLLHIPVDTYWKRFWVIMDASLEWIHSPVSALLSLAVTISIACLARPLLLWRPFR
ncbi:MAG: acyltransferase family protein [Bryobacter sp.]|nr:acyltransferase family protein [Bryobacter sp.]